MRFLTIFFIAVLLPNLLCGNGYYFFQNITRGFDLTNVAINTICEDDNGFVWFGGINGLYYHNTLEIDKVKLYTDKKGVAKPIRITQLYKDNNNIWVCSDKGLFKYIESKNAFEHKKLYLDNKEFTVSIINGITKVDEGIYCLLSQRKVLIYNEQTNLLLPVASGIKGSVSVIHREDDGSIYLGTNNGNVYVTKDNFKEITLLSKSSKGVVSTICKDGNKYYIGYFNRGIDVLNIKGIKIAELRSTLQGDSYIKDDHIRKILKRENGEVWIATHSGIIVLNQGKTILLDSQYETGLPHRTIYTMCKGRNSKIWVGTYAGGVACYSDYNYIFSHTSLNNSRKEADRSHVAVISEDSRGYLWIGSEDDGVVKVYNPATDSYISEIDKATEQKYNIKDVKAIVPLTNNLVAIGKNLSNVIIIYNYSTKQVEKRIVLPLPADPGVRGAKLFEGKLWVNDRNNIVNYDLTSGEIKKMFKTPSRIWQIYIDTSHNLWITTTKGVYVKRPGNDTIKKCNLKQADIDLNKTSIYSISEDANGLIWIGTMGQGLYIYRQDSESIELAPDRHLTAEADIYSLITDQYNNMWYITSQGIYRYDTSNERTDYYGVNDGISNYRSRLNSSICSSSGILYFGTKNGFNVITPANIKKNPEVPEVFLASFTVNNNPFISDSNMINNSLILSKMKHISLEAQQNTLGFRVVSNNYIKAEKNRFKYRLVNYDDKLLEVAQGKEIVYTKVPPGEYIFEAYGSNNDNVWSEQPYRLKITILSPYYARWYAILIYLGATLALAFFIIKEIKIKIRLRKEIAEERYKTRTNELIHSERIKLFTNISHEFRTPLSLILSPISYLLNKKSLDDETKYFLNVADRNAKRLLKIADQSLDFRLLEIGKLKPNFRSHDIIRLVEDVYFCFEQQLIDKQIKFSFSTEFKKLELRIDGDMIEKTIYNLLSNALKYTPEGENIYLSVSEKILNEGEYKIGITSGSIFTGKAVCITVKDTGDGIPKELLPYIFDRFAKGKRSHETSTGIGLHLCAEYSKMNKGNMQLITEEGKGASFILNLPVLEDSDYAIDKELTIKCISETDVPIKLQQSTNNLDAATILLVEDNGELRNFLKTLLGIYYKIITAANAEGALKILEDLMPELIITDVSMPGISGIELTKKLKQDQALRHIPIIVMTAYTDRKYQMESILCGAEAFFTKPIDEAILLAQVSTVLKKRKLNKVDTSEKEQTVVRGDFIHQVEQIIERNLQNQNFEIPYLLQELNVSKTTLRRKIQDETQMNPSGFIREIRLKNAVKLLANNEFNIDEIADYVGFNSTSYFIRTFKEKYGITPNEYRKGLKKK